jgi:hypothetical protein
MCAKVRTVLFLPRRVLLTTVVSDRRDFPDYGGDGPRRSAAMAGRTRHGSGRFGCQLFQVQLQVQRRETAVAVRSGHRNQPSLAFPTLQRPDRDTGKFCRPACADRAFHEHDHYRVLYGKLESVSLDSRTLLQFKGSLSKPMTRQYQAGVYHCGVLLIQGVFPKTHNNFTTGPVNDVKLPLIQGVFLKTHDGHSTELPFWSVYL